MRSAFYYSEVIGAAYGTYSVESKKFTAVKPLPIEKLRMFVGDIVSGGRPHISVDGAAIFGTAFATSTPSGSVSPVLLFDNQMVFGANAVNAVEGYTRKSPYSNLIAFSVGVNAVCVEYLAGNSAY